MNEKETGELRRSLSLEKNAVSRIHACYVNAAGEIISRFDQSLGMMSQEQAEKYLAILRKTLSGTPEKNLLDIPFTTSQVLESPQHKLLTVLLSSGLEDEEALTSFFETVIRSLGTSTDNNYVILLAYERYDVPFRGKDGLKVEGGDSEEIFPFILCSICPVKMTKSALTYDAAQKNFTHYQGACAVSAPELGFLFPAFDDRKTNIYDALLYTHSIDDDHQDFTEAVFGSHIRMTAASQGQTFHKVLADSLEEACSFGVAKSVHAQLSQRMEEHKQNHEKEPLVINQYVVEECLENCGIAPEKLEAFGESYKESFGKGTDLPPKNIIDPKKFQVTTPDVVIKVAPGHSDLVEARVIDGVRYILIRADDGVELNGLDVSIT